MQKNKNVDIFIYSHIPFSPCPCDQNVYKILTNSKEDDSRFHTNLPIYRDYEGEDNIADKNLMYNEYSGFYWLWKNYPLKDYIGLNHYRRMYDNCNNLPDINKIFTKKKIILNSSIPLIIHEGLPRSGETLNNREWYKYWHNIEDFNLLGDIIKEKYPQYYDGFQKMAETKYLYGCSMFIMPRKTFTRYCEFIFPLLEEFNNRMNCFTTEDYIQHVTNKQDKYIRKWNPYYDIRIQSRIVGYIAERALNSFLMSGGKNSLEKNAEIFNWKMIDPELYEN